MTSITQPAAPVAAADPAQTGYPLPPLPDPVPARPSAYPTQPTIYPHALRTDRPGWWRGAVALLLLIIGFGVISTVFGLGALLFDILSTGVPFMDYVAGGISMTPALFLGNNLALAAMLPLAMGIQALVFGQRPGFLSSVLGRFRWRWLLRAAVVVVPIYLIMAVVSAFLPGAPPARPATDVIGYVLIIVATTPLQAAGEEYATRGLINRSVGSWFAKPVLALVVGGVVNSAIFMLAHGASDPWLLVYYFVFGMIMTVLAWRTGGLEVPVLLHAANNVFLLVPAAASGQMGELMNRGDGAGSPVMLVQMAVAVLTVVLVEWRARRSGVVTTTASA